jgi:hypothetical protein
LTLNSLGFIRDDLRNQRHPRSIDAFFAANTNCRPVYAEEVTNRLIRMALGAK